MRLLPLTTLLLSTLQLITTTSIPPPSTRPSSLLIRSPPTTPHPTYSLSRLLLKRKGGGGGGGKGGGSSSSGSSSSGSSSSGGKSSSSGRTSSSSTNRNSNSGGTTRTGSGPQPAYGSYYGGGARVPYKAGQKSGRISPLFLPVAAFAFFPALWLYGSLYAYPFATPYYYSYNGGNGTSGNQSVEVTCLCQRYGVCGCDDNENGTFLEQVIGRGTGRPVNSSEVVVLPLLENGTQRAYINGSLPNGTTMMDPQAQEMGLASVAAAAGLHMRGYVGYWVMVVTVVASVLA